MAAQCDTIKTMQNTFDPYQKKYVTMQRGDRSTCRRNIVKSGTRTAGTLALKGNVERRRSKSSALEAKDAAWVNSSRGTLATWF